MPSPTTQPDQPPVKRSRQLRVRPAYIALLFCMALFTYWWVEKTQEVQRLSAQRAALALQNEQLRRDNAQQKQIIAWRRGRAYIEQAARSVGYVLPGDVAIQSIPRKQRVEAIRAAPPAPLLPPKPAWQQWWDVFVQ